jgi:hypothetical protein
MQKTKSQTGSVHIVVITVAVAVVIGVLGFVFWNNFLKKDSNVSKTEDKTTTKPTEPCGSGENIAAESGTFCSKSMGIRFAVPSMFKNKIIKADNYEVFQGSLDPSTKKSAGMSENVYRGSIEGAENFTLTIAQEPLRTGYVDVYHALQNSYYDQTKGELTRVNTPTRSYNSATDSYTVSGEYSVGEAVPSFDVSGVRFFKGSNGDAGQMENVYFGVVNGKIIKISLKSAVNPAAEPTNDADQLFADFDKSIKSLEIIKE